MAVTLGRLRRQQGFTLIEVVIILLVLAILVALVLFAVDPFEESAKSSVRTANDDTCRTAARAAEILSSEPSDLAPGCLP